MSSSAAYELCLPLLQDSSLDEEDRTQAVTDLLSEKLKITDGKALETTVLDVLWQYRNSVKIRDKKLEDTRSQSRNKDDYSQAKSEPNYARKGSSPSSDLRSLPPGTNDTAVQVQATQSKSHETCERTWEAVSGTKEHDNDLNDPAELTSFDMLRLVLGSNRSDSEIELALIAHDYDLAAAISNLTKSPNAQTPIAANAVPAQQEKKRVTIGKSIYVDPSSYRNRDEIVSSTAVCKYWLAHGKCLRADCRFSHDTNTHVCKYWLRGNCLLGESCPFSHNLASLNRNADLSNGDSHPIQPSITDENAFPSLGPLPAKAAGTALGNRSAKPIAGYDRNASSFPTLGEASVKIESKQQRRKKRGTDSPSHISISLAEKLRDSTLSAPIEASSNNRPSKTRDRSIHIAAPQHIPWLETGSKVNSEYLRIRSEAFKHGGLRNQYLQRAAQAWQRGDASAAKTWSVRGQEENQSMRNAHRNAARALYESRNKDETNSKRASSEIYVDLHGLHPEEAIEYLEEALIKHQQSSGLKPRSNAAETIVYAITGTGHHSKNGKDKVSLAVQDWLNSWSYAFREFNMEGDTVGGILGIDPDSFDKLLDQSR